MSDSNSVSYAKGWADCMDHKNIQLKKVMDELALFKAEALAAREWLELIGKPIFESLTSTELNTLDKYHAARKARGEALVKKTKYCEVSGIKLDE